MYIPSRYFFYSFQKYLGKREENKKVLPGTNINDRFYGWSSSTCSIRSSTKPNFKATIGVSESVYIDFIEKEGNSSFRVFSYKKC